MANVWLVVAESSRAKIYQTDLNLSGLTEIGDFVHPASRQHAQEISSDLPGSRASSGAGSHHSVDNETGIKEEEAIEFAKQIDAHLEKSHNQGEYDKLAIVAAPAFLGLLCKNMNAKVSDLVVYELDKNLLHCSGDELKGHLPAKL